jgi:hypothetical protein
VQPPSASRGRRAAAATPRGEQAGIG